MTGQTATQTPTGFHIMMPPGWVRYLVDDEGKRALLTQTSARMRDLSRPDLDAQARTLVEGQWRKLIASGVTAVYLPVETTDILPPASIAVHYTVTWTSFHACDDLTFGGSHARVLRGRAEGDAWVFNRQQPLPMRHDSAEEF